MRVRLRRTYARRIGRSLTLLLLLTHVRQTYYAILQIRPVRLLVNSDIGIVEGNQWIVSTAKRQIGALAANIYRSNQIK